MGQNKLAKLVNIAKGNDRTIREYATAAGVNVSTISRTIKGEYKPGVKVLRKLTSKEAAPRGGITFNDLFEATGFSNEVTFNTALGSVSAILAASIPVFGQTLVDGTVAAVMIAEKEKKSRQESKLLVNNKNEANEKCKSFTIERLSEYNRHLHRFSATATGLIYGKMAQKGLRFRPSNIDELDFQCYEDDSVVELEECNISTWLFRFIAISEADRGLDKFAKDVALNMFSQLVLIPSDVKRKISIVVNHMELYEHLLRYKGHNSYHGNLSIILIDTKEVSIRKEEYLSLYDTANEENLIEIV